MTQTAAQVKAQRAACKAEGIPIISAPNVSIINRFWMKIWCFQENAAGEFVQCAAYVPVFHDSHTALAAIRIGPNPDQHAKNAGDSLLPVYVDHLQKWMDRVTPQLETQAETIGHRQPDAALIKSLLKIDDYDRECREALAKHKSELKAAIAAKRNKPGKDSKRTPKQITVTQGTRKKG